MISILTPRRSVMKKSVLLQKLTVFQGRFSGKEVLTDCRAGGVRARQAGWTGQRKNAGHSAGTAWASWRSEAGVVLCGCAGWGHGAFLTLPSPQRTLDGGCPWGEGVTCKRTGFPREDCQLKTRKQHFQYLGPQGFHSRRRIWWHSLSMIFKNEGNIAFLSQ